MVSKFPIRLETCVKIVLQMTSVDEAVVKMQSETLLAQLDVKGFVFVDWKPDICLPFSFKVSFWVSDCLL